MKKHLFAIALLGSLTLPVCAQGLYVFADYERNKMEIDLDGLSLNKTKNGYGLGLGYELNQTFAVEIAYRDLMGSSERESNSDYEARSNIDITAIQASVVASYPLNNAISIFGRLGVGKIEADSDYYENDAGTVYRDSESDSKTKALFGLGASYAFSEKLAARAEYSQFAEFEDITFSALSLAVVYHF